MNLAYTPQEGAALWSLLADNSSDIIVRTDPGGFIVHASPAIAALGLQRGHDLFGRHLLDLVDPAYQAPVRSKLSVVAAGGQDESWTELATWTANGDRRWFEIRMHPIDAQRGGAGPAGVLGVMRSIDDRKAFERQLFVATLTDPLTGLSNRTAFTRMLGHLAEGDGGCVAILDIDHFKAINLQYGQSVGDEVLVAFADYVRTELSESDIISRIGGESFAILFPGVTLAEAETTCARIVHRVAQISRAAGASAIPITASAGLSSIDGGVDGSLRRVELALALAKAKGRNRLEVERG